MIVLDVADAAEESVNVMFRLGADELVDEQLKTSVLLVPEVALV